MNTWRLKPPANLRECARLVGVGGEEEDDDEGEETGEDEGGDFEGRCRGGRR